MSKKKEKIRRLKAEKAQLERALDHYIRKLNEQNRELDELRKQISRANLEEPS